ncbi:galactokinase [Anaerorhabdus furcosa]|uniref:Galactokinase n=1 Tax=Anaerorhabdus furcosa TaxID=118967 RepID=A0A1T4Q3R9_9FIRM|nr:galactokinase family protein [Anaerorhabdus furcosa]SJZ98177.1 galactokinase [Anaerorhabdus furcosa]
MKITEIKQNLLAGKFDEQLKMINCRDDIENEKDRYAKLLDQALAKFGDDEAHLICAPGRTEVGGNHTDHQQGRVLAASVNMDIATVVVPCANACEYYAEGFEVKPVSVDDLAIKEEEKFTSESLIRGTLARFKELGYHIGGFKAISHSNVLQGSGISSSAAFEVLLGTILSEIYNDGKIDHVEIAKIGQYAENNYFMKPCGLLDQMACSVGGFVTIDFKDKQNPIVEQVKFDFAHSDYALCLVDTKGSHADLSDEYGLMPKEMKDVAKVLGKEVLSQCTKEEFLKNIKKIREQCSDRALLRAIHFFNETDRVIDQVNALKNNDLETFKKLIIESGYSSYMYLQNVYTTKDIENQNLSLALAISEQLLQNSGAYRVHGGGLAGTIQAFVPKTMLEEYKNQMNEIYGDGSCFVLSIRPVGGYKII